jgi:hypothetical protein
MVNGDNAGTLTGRFTRNLNFYPFTIHQLLFPYFDKVPFVDITPLMRSSLRTACERAREADLKTASMM